MSRSLPPEIFDLIVDQLHYKPAALKACCLVSRSWIPGTRRHLFAHVEFDPVRHHFASWIRSFPDPSNSPAHHTHSLTIHRFPNGTTADTNVANYFRTFHNVVHLHFKFLYWTNHESPLVPFHGFSHRVRSLRLTHTSFEVFDLICSFPLLEDLEFVEFRPGSGTAEWSAPSTSPKLTGSLDLRSMGGIYLAIRRLLDFPDGLHFAGITASCFDGDFESLADLASRCSGTLEYLNLYCFSPGMSLDLSKATKLRDLMFRCRIPNIRWVATALQSIESKNLQQITIRLYPITPVDSIEEGDYRDLQELDRVLVQFWTSHSLRPRFVYAPEDGEKDTRDHLSRLLPELTRRGLVDVPL